MCARCILYIRTSLRALQAGIYNNSHLIKNLFRLPKKPRFFYAGFYYIETVNACCHCSKMNSIDNIFIIISNPLPIEVEKPD